MLVGTVRNRPSTSNCHTIVSIECWWVQPKRGPPLPTVAQLFRLNVGEYSPKQNLHFQLSHQSFNYMLVGTPERDPPLPTVPQLFESNVVGHSPKQALHFQLSHNCFNRMLVGTARKRPSTSNCHTIVLITCWWVDPKTGPPIPTVTPYFLITCWLVQPQTSPSLPSGTP